MTWSGAKQVFTRLVFRRGTLALGALLLFSVLGSAAEESTLVLTAGEQTILDAIDQYKFVRTRELASSVLQDNPDSFFGHYGLAIALLEGDGNIPAALREARIARGLAETGSGWARTGYHGWHYNAMSLEQKALSDMGRYQEVLKISRRIRTFYESDVFERDVWAHMKLGQVEAARQAAKMAIASGDPIAEVVALNGLCALEGYHYCEATLEAVRRHELPPGLSLRNLAVASAEMGQLAQAEQLLIEASQNPGPESNPWRDLANLYVDQGRLAEAAAAAGKMVTFSRRLSPRARQYARSEELTTSAMVLLLAGHPVRALDATNRALAEPDRAAHWSGSGAEIRAETELLHRSIHNTLAELEAEAATMHSLTRAPVHRLHSFQHRSAAWLSGRRVLPLLLDGAMRPHDAPEQQLPELGGSSWLILDAVAYFGPGPTLALMQELIAHPPGETSPVPEQIRESYLRAFESEAYFLAGDFQQCLVAGVRSREILPPEEVLMRSRLALRMAISARRLGRWEEATPYLAEVLATDPGLLRRLGQPLPVRPVSKAKDLVSRAARHLLATRRFTEDSESPFAFAAAGDELCLVSANGYQFACAADPGPPPEQPKEQSRPDDDRERLPPLRPEELKDPDRRLALVFLNTLFTPRVDITQADLDTLDGAGVSDRGLDERSLDLLMYPSAREPSKP